jgi:peptidoglycan/LPS O-acetylase OafA/YrhL
MKAWTRWQDYATMVFGVVLVISPFVFDKTSQHGWSFYADALGALLVLSGIVGAASPAAWRARILSAPNIAALITMYAAFVLFFSGADGHEYHEREEHVVALAAAAMAIATVLVSATLRRSPKAVTSSQKRQ